MESYTTNSSKKGPSTASTCLEGVRFWPNSINWPLWGRWHPFTNWAHLARCRLPVTATSTEHKLPWRSLGWRWWCSWGPLCTSGGCWYRCRSCSTGYWTNGVFARLPIQTPSSTHEGVEFWLLRFCYSSGWKTIKEKQGFQLRNMTRAENQPEYRGPSKSRVQNTSALYVACYNNLLKSEHETNKSTYESASDMLNLSIVKTSREKHLLNSHNTCTSFDSQTLWWHLRSCRHRGWGDSFGLFVVKRGCKVNLTISFNNRDCISRLRFDNINVILFVVVRNHDIVTNCKTREVSQSCLQPEHQDKMMI